MKRPTSRLALLGCGFLLVAACTINPTELQVGDCVQIIGAGSSEASDRLETVDCRDASGDGFYRVVWIEPVTDNDPVTVTRLAAECNGPTLLPDADMLAAGDNTVACFEPIE